MCQGGLNKNLRWFVLRVGGGLAAGLQVCRPGKKTPHVRAELGQKRDADGKLDANEKQRASEARGEMESGDWHALDLPCDRNLVFTGNVVPWGTSPGE